MYIGSQIASRSAIVAARTAAKIANTAITGKTCLAIAMIQRVARDHALPRAEGLDLGLGAICGSAQWRNVIVTANPRSLLAQPAIGRSSSFFDECL